MRAYVCCVFCAVRRIRGEGSADIVGELGRLPEGARLELRDSETRRHIWGNIYNYIVLDKNALLRVRWQGFARRGGSEDHETVDFTRALDAPQVKKSGGSLDHPLE